MSRAKRRLILTVCYGLFAVGLIAQEPVDPPSTYVFPAYGHSYGIRKAGPTELFLFLGLRVKFSNPQGLACVRLNSWDDPDDPHDDDEVTVYGVNSGQNNIIYNSSMWGLGVYGPDQEPPAQLNRPNGICANSTGDVYVADTGNNRIVKLFNPAHQLEFVTAFGDSGSAPGQFDHPRQIALDNTGYLYVSDTRNHRVQVFDRQHNLRFVFDNNRKMLFPDGIAIADSAEMHRYRNDNFIIVIDSSNQRISKFSLTGELIRQTRMSQIGYNKAWLAYICLDYYNQLHITDLENHCLHKFDKDLNHIVSFGSYGSDDHQFIEPRGIAIYRRFGQLFIAEREGAQYYWIGTDILDPGAKETGPGYEISFRITEPSFVSAEIFDHEGGLVKLIADHVFLQTAGSHRLFWDKTAGNYSDKFYQKEAYTASSLVRRGDSVPAGSYRLRLAAEPTYSSRSYFIREINLTLSLAE